jgi:pimeloyl-ACP methyl ester carboxylesterase
MSKKPNYTKGSITSKDGTIIGYRQIGNGPGIIILHGGGKGSQTLMKLGSALSDEFTVYIPDRRGRGLSGSFGDQYGLKREVEDMDALLKKTGAHNVFGTATGGTIALQSALELSAIHKAVIFELVFYINKEEMDNFNEIGKRYDQQVNEGKLGAAMWTLGEIATKVSGDPTPSEYNWITYIPDSIWILIFRLILEFDGLMVSGDDVPLRELLLTFHNDLLLINETKGTLENFKDVSAEILLLSSRKPFLFITHILDALNKVLPHIERAVIQEGDHEAAEERGKPLLVAQELKRFYKSK